NSVAAASATTTNSSPSIIEQDGVDSEAETIELEKIVADSSSTCGDDGILSDGESCVDEEVFLESENGDNVLVVDMDTLIDVDDSVRKTCEFSELDTRNTAVSKSKKISVTSNQSHNARNGSNASHDNARVLRARDVAQPQPPSTSQENQPPQHPSMSQENQSPFGSQSKPQQQPSTSKEDPPPAVPHPPKLCIQKERKERVRFKPCNPHSKQETNQSQSQQRKKGEVSADDLSFHSHNVKAKAPLPKDHRFQHDGDPDTFDKCWGNNTLKPFEIYKDFLCHRKEVSSTTLDWVTRVVKTRNQDRIILIPSPTESAKPATRVNIKKLFPKLSENVIMKLVDNGYPITDSAMDILHNCFRSKFREMERLYRVNDYLQFVKDLVLDKLP
ncbi:hypothetical protein HDU76_009981, partial [Blyttiomyces sp. JEL0837]